MSDLRVSFVVHGEPVPKQSFRFARGGGFTDPRVRDWQDLVRATALQSVGDNVDNDAYLGPWGVRLEFHRKSARAVDLDNLSKAVLDALNGVVWKDDRQVVELRVRKLPSAPKDSPCVLIEAWPLEGDDDEDN